MRNEYFPEGIPANIAERFDGILDDAEGLGNLRRPDLDDLIEQLVGDVDSWEGDLGEHGRGTTETVSLWDVVCKLEIIAILAQLKQKQLVS